MRIADALRNSGLDPADAEVLLAGLLGRDRAWLLAHGDGALPADTLDRWNAARERRQDGEPVAYILGRKEFYGRAFTVDRRALVPRPATEGLIGAALAFLRRPEDAVTSIDAGIVAVSRAFDRPGSENIRSIVDVGTGSGCIAVTLALERPDLAVYASDLGEDALALARENAAALGARVAFLQGDGLAPFSLLREPFLLVSNPPYVPSGTPLERDVADYEPHAALFAGTDGLDVLLPLARAAEEHPSCAGMIVECREDQTNFLTAIR
jgi:release factor glutamine methyltransferase